VPVPAAGRSMAAKRIAAVLGRIGWWRMMMMLLLLLLLMVVVLIGGLFALRSG
jgi:hypothetical protein